MPYSLTSATACLRSAVFASASSKTGCTRDEAYAQLAAANPQGRLVRPDEVASAVAWLVMPEQAAITGQAIAVAGGEVL
jgi:NAD(P)-dependent dehydrogenase (short-subunit alcohol dehydrogenase family)